MRSVSFTPRNPGEPWLSIQGWWLVSGGIAERNSQISAGGTGHHSTGDGLRRAKQAGARFVNLSPIRQDVSDDLAAEWLAIRPGSDVAVMLGLAHELLINDLHDRQFLDRYTVGFDTFEAYLTAARTDGQAKTAEWGGINRQHFS